MREQSKYSLDRLLSLNELLRCMNSRHRKVALKIIQSEKEKFFSAPGGLHKHQNWIGGYKDHVQEVMNIALILYTSLSKIRKLTFTVSEALYMSFLHDLEKMFNLTSSKNGDLQRINCVSGANSIQKTLHILAKYKITLSRTEKNVIKYVHGENQDHHPTRRIMEPLTAFVHCCDMISARIWYSFPTKARRRISFKK